MEADMAIAIAVGLLVAVGFAVLLTLHSQRLGRIEERVADIEAQRAAEAERVTAARKAIEAVRARRKAKRV